MNHLAGGLGLAGETVAAQDRRSPNPVAWRWNLSFENPREGRRLQEPFAQRHGNRSCTLVTGTTPKLWRINEGTM